MSWDLAVVSNDFGLASSEQYLTKIDCSVVPCTKLQPDRYKTTGYRVPFGASGTALAYNTTKMPSGQTPKDWTDFFNVQKFPGKRVAMADTGSFPIEAALLGDGVSASQLYPLDLPRAERKWDSIKSSLRFTNDYQQCADDVARGEAVMGLCWQGRLIGQIDSNHAPIAIAWKGTFASGVYFVVPKGAPHPKEAMQFIAFATSADHDADLNNYYATAPANPGAADKVASKFKNYVVSTYPNDVTYPDDVWWDENGKQTVNTWQAWISGG